MFGGITDVFKNIPGLNVLSTAMDLIEGIKTGDMGKILSSVSQLALTYATGGAGAMFGSLTSMLSQMGSQMTSAALTGSFGIEAGLKAIQTLGQQMGLSQSSIDAAQGAFAEQMGDKKTARSEYLQAGHGFTVSGSERAQANDFLNMIKDSVNKGGSFFGPLGSAILAGPGAGPAQLGGAQGLFGKLMESLVNSLIQNVLGGMAGEAGMGGGTSATDTGTDLGTQLVNDRIGADAEEGAKEKKKPGEAGAAIMNELGISGGGFLLKFAILMGEAMDKKTDDLMKVAEAMNQEADKIGGLNGDVMDKKGGLGGLFGGKEVNQDKQNDFNKQMQESNSRMQTLGSIQGGIAKEMEALQSAFDTALNAIGESQKKNAGQ